MNFDDIIAHMRAHMKDDKKTNCNSMIRSLEMKPVSNTRLSCYIV